MLTRTELLRISKPILFNTEMVRAILNGRKTATRRCVKPQLDACPSCMYMNVDYIYDENAQNIYCARCGEPFNPTIKSPYQSGDILYVRETFRPLSSHPKAGVEYAADWSPEYFENSRDPKACNGGKWKPSLHMPKEAARIFLKVTDARVERLQDITIEGCEKEGCWCGNNGDIFAFMQLWDSTIKKSDRNLYSWDANPWVWVIEFERIYPDD